MIMERKLVLNQDDIYHALKQYVDNNVNGIDGMEVCNFRLEKSPNDKDQITVTLQDKKIST